MDTALLQKSGFPDYASRVTFGDNTDYNCPSSGVVYLSATDFSSGQLFISINGTEYSNQFSTGGYGVGSPCLWPVAQGDVVRVRPDSTYSAHVQYFITFR